MISVCVDCGDLSPLSPLSIRDLILLELFSAKRSKSKFDRWKISFEDELRRHRELLGYLLDIRQVQLDKIPFDTKQKKLMYLENLPSCIILDDGKQKKKKTSGMSKKAKKNLEKSQS